MDDSTSATAPRRYLPDKPLPPYSYVTGRHPHPIGDPRGHSFAHRPPQATCPGPDQWRKSEPFLFGVDLFNHGYYWEAHEVWESIWHACSAAAHSQSPAADFVKGLIKLAAAGVKAREGRPIGVRRHAARALELFQLTRERVGPAVRRYWGLELEVLLAVAAEVRDAGALSDAAELAPVKIVFSFRLEPA
jgi:uncharacterized protein